MAGQRDSDGVLRVPARPGARKRGALGVVLVALVGLGGWIGLQPKSAPEPRAPAPRPLEAQGATAPPPAAPRIDPMERAIKQALAQAPRGPAAAEAKKEEEAAAASPAPTEQQKEVYVDQLEPGDGTGIHAFPKPGTKQLKSGLIVPDGFTLPEGYLRHVQSTDDGRQLPPILMFHPDYRPLDAQGRPVALPESRIVPPELAPPGMPLQWLQAPAVREGLEAPEQE